ncbi:protein translocase subunit SecF [Zooshikella ganghwensis]|uniref:Protein-export membrane protein SecF n=1 Tax=Zooshikella ganghwensis TaxID=202772 RepID=A0A4P9VK96_9GAMM|nr:protein translocase subunit SecF [Zooshikella ganghwensis]RDH42959.1 protein translocase subunit SecF [Zooshikella ganghwensis]
MNNERVIQFMSARVLAVFFSLALIIGSIGTLVINNLQYGLDFTGGTLIELGYEQPVRLDDIREQLKQAGYDQATVQEYGSATDILVRLPGDDPKQGDKVAGVLSKASTGNVELHRVEFVGPQVGEELREKGGLAMLLALAVVLIYIALRFQLKFALGAVLALVHDVIITLGFFAVTGFTFDLTVLAAILAVIGYSLNDTIVVSDRIRENFRVMHSATPIEVINYSLTQTLGRTLITSITTLLVLAALAIFAGESLRSFSLALIVGVVIGTYSSIYVAANVLIAMKVSREDLLPPEKEEVVDDMP